MKFVNYIKISVLVFAMTFLLNDVSVKLKISRGPIA